MPGNLSLAPNTVSQLHSYQYNTTYIQYSTIKLQSTVCGAHYHPASLHFRQSFTGPTPRIIYMLHMDWKRLRKLHKIIRNGETVLVNMFTEISTIVHSEVLQMFV